MKTTDEELNAWRYGFPSTAVSWNLSGDETSCQAYMGEAKNLLYGLKNRMKLGGLKSLQTYRDYPDGTRIIARSVFGMDYIEINAGPVQPIEDKFRGCKVEYRPYVNLQPGIRSVITFTFDDGEKRYIDLLGVQPKTGFDDFTPVLALRVVEHDPTKGAVFFHENHRVNISEVLPYQVLIFELTTPTVPAHQANLLGTDESEGSSYYTQYDFTYSVDTFSDVSTEHPTDLYPLTIGAAGGERGSVIHTSGVASQAGSFCTHTHLGAIPNVIPAPPDGNYTSTITYGEVDTCYNPFGDPEICTVWNNDSHEITKTNTVALTDNSISGTVYFAPEGFAVFYSKDEAGTYKVGWEMLCSYYLSYGFSYTTTYTQTGISDTVSTVHGTYNIGDFLATVRNGIIDYKGHLSSLIEEEYDLTIELPWGVFEHPTVYRLIPDGWRLDRTSIEDSIPYRIMTVTPSTNEHGDSICVWTDDHFTFDYTSNHDEIVQTKLPAILLGGSPYYSKTMDNVDGWMIGYESIVESSPSVYDYNFYSYDLPRVPTAHLPVLLKTYTNILSLGNAFTLGGGIDSRKTVVVQYSVMVEGVSVRYSDGYYLINGLLDETIIATSRYPYARKSIALSTKPGKELITAYNKFGDKLRETPFVDLPPWYGIGNLHNNTLQYMDETDWHMTPRGYADYRYYVAGDYGIERVKHV